MFEILKVCLICLYLFSLALLRNQTLPQIGVSYTFYFLYFTAQIMIRPFENKMENVFATLSEGCFMIVLFLLLILGLQDIHEYFEESKRANLGWIIIFFIFLVVFMKFTSTVIELYKFRKRIVTSSKLIFFFNEKSGYNP